MSKVYSKLELNVKGGRMDIITRMVQNDSNSRYLDVVLLDGSTPIDLTGQEVRIFMRKPEEGGEIFNDGEITNAKAGRCQFLMTTEALARMGHLEAQITIWKNNTEILSTQIFQIFVTKSLHTEGSIESSNEYGALVVLFQNVYEAFDLMTEMVQAFGEAGAIASVRKLTTFWQGVEYLAKYMDTDLKNMIQEALANASVDEVLKRIGLTNNTGGTATAGTLMAKANKIISQTVDKGIRFKASKLLHIDQASNIGTNILTDNDYIYVGSNSILRALDRHTLVQVASVPCDGGIGELYHTDEYICARATGRIIVFQKSTLSIKCVKALTFNNIPCMRAYGGYLYIAYYGDLSKPGGIAKYDLTSSTTALKTYTLPANFNQFKLYGNSLVFDGCFSIKADTFEVENAWDANTGIARKADFWKEGTKYCSVVGDKYGGSAKNAATALYISEGGLECTDAVIYNTLEDGAAEPFLSLYVTDNYLHCVTDKRIILIDKATLKTVGKLTIMRDGGSLGCVGDSIYYYHNRMVHKVDIIKEN